MPGGKDYASDDPGKLPQRLINHVRVLTSASLKSLSLRDAQGQSGDIVSSLHHDMQTAEIITSLGVEVLGLSILAIRPTPDTSRALEADAREEADCKAYSLSAVMKALSGTDPKTIQALAGMGMDAGQLVALAFRDLAENADKIGELNVSPELLRELLDGNSQK